ncbi:MAG: hypothetical protein VZQ55_06290 [Ruminococcus sp.]|nr:hypothetical protein [Ruminococcus sp.]
MKAVLLSIKPKYCELIANRKKTIEIRKTEPKLRAPFKCFIYCTKGKDNLYNVDNRIVLNNYKVTFDTNGNALETIYQLNGTVIGEFICDGIIDFHDNGETFVAITDYDLTGCCLNYKEHYEYANGKVLYGWHIADLKIYDKPKELSEFRKAGGRQCVSDNGRCCKYIQASPGDDPADANTMSCIYGERNCPFEHLNHPPQSWCYVE